MTNDPRIEAALDKFCEHVIWNWADMGEAVRDGYRDKWRDRVSEMLDAARGAAGVPEQARQTDGLSPDVKGFLESAARVDALVFDRLRRERDALRRYVGDQTYETLCGAGSRVAADWMASDPVGYFADVRAQMKDEL